MRTPVTASVVFTLEPLSVNGGRDVYWVRQTDKMLVVEYVGGYVENAFGDNPAINLVIVHSGSTVPSGGEWPMQISGANNVFQQQTTIFVPPRHVLYMHAARRSQSSFPTFYRLSIAGYLVDAA